jgi:hypothetical protein
MASCITGISEILPIITATLLIGIVYLKLAPIELVLISEICIYFI